MTGGGRAHTHRLQTEIALRTYMELLDDDDDYMMPPHSSCHHSVSAQAGFSLHEASSSHFFNCQLTLFSCQSVSALLAKYLLIQRWI